MASLPNFDFAEICTIDDRILIKCWFF